MLSALDNEATVLTRLVMCTDNLEEELVANTSGVGEVNGSIMVIPFPL